MANGAHVLSHSDFQVWDAVQLQTGRPMMGRHTCNHDDWVVVQCTNQENSHYTNQQLPPTPHTQRETLQQNRLAGAWFAPGICVCVGALMTYLDPQRSLLLSSPSLLSSSSVLLLLYSFFLSSCSTLFLPSPPPLLSDHINCSVWVHSHFIKLWSSW